MTQQKLSVEQAWTDYQKQLFSFIRSKVNTAEDAEDILNDVFLRLTKTANKDPLPNPISGWLYQVTKNRIVDYYRAKKHFDPLPTELAIEAQETTTIKQLSNCILPMIHALPEHYQRPLFLSEIEGKKYKEIAIELKLSVSAIKSRILRGRAKLLKSMTNCCTLYHNKTGEVIDYETKNRSKNNKACTLSC
jgi:RNA polymerase sigma-70 factor (ECF subfamily)